MTCRHQAAGNFLKRDLLLLLGDLAGLLRSLLHCALRLLCLLSFLGHVALLMYEMALLLRALGNRDALHPEYTNASKKTLSCLRKCCRACIRMRSARSPATQQCIGATMRAVRENAMQTNVSIAGSACAAGVFVINTFDDRRAFDVAATHRCRLKAYCADSESRFLAIKKFSCPPASRLIVARQNQFFARIAAADSQCDFSSA